MIRLVKVGLRIGNPRAPRLGGSYWLKSLSRVNPDLHPASGIALAVKRGDKDTIGVLRSTGLRVRHVQPPRIRVLSWPQEFHNRYLDFAAHPSVQNAACGTDLKNPGVCTASTPQFLPHRGSCDVAPQKGRFRRNAKRVQRRCTYLSSSLSIETDYVPSIPVQIQVPAVSRCQTLRNYYLQRQLTA